MDEWQKGKIDVFCVVFGVFVSLLICFVVFGCNRICGEKEKRSAPLGFGCMWAGKQQMRETGGGVCSMRGRRRVRVSVGKKNDECLVVVDGCGGESGRKVRKERKENKEVRLMSAENRK